MKRRTWKRVRPVSLRHALELSLQHAKEVHNRGVERVAELMGLANHWILYKYTHNGRLPAVLVRPFEHACGVCFVSDYLVYASHRLVVDIPSGRKATATDINELQGSFNEAVGLLLRYYDGKTEAEETLAALHQTMTDLAWHEKNLQQYAQPELGLFDEEAAS